MDDCLIVGAGVIGLSIAYDLACHGVRVRVIDQGEPGREASWAGAGILPPANFETAEHPYEQLQGLSHRLHPVWAERLREETGLDTGYRRCGGLYVSRSSGEAAALVGLAGLLKSMQIEVERLTPPAVAHMEPALQSLVDSGKLRAALLLPEEAQLRNPWHVHALLKACVRRGVVVEDKLSITEIHTHARRIDAIQTVAGERKAERYCFCAGAWTFGLLQRLGIRCGVLPVRGQMVLFRCPSTPFRHVINEGSRYLVPREDGHVLAGSTEEEVGFDKSTTAEGIRDLMRFAQDLIPTLTEACVEKTWAGLRPGSLDGFPYLGTIPGFDDAFVAAGHFRSGLHLSPGTAVVMSQLIRGENTTIDLSPFSIGRG